MKMFTATPTRSSGSSAAFFGAAILVAALTMPASVFSQTLAPIDLLSTANFAILAGSTIANSPTSAISGDVGVSPSAGSFIAGFGLTEVTGTIYAVDATYPTADVAVIDPARLTAAKGDLTIAYNDAAGRTPVPTGDFLNPGAGNLGGLTLAPGLFKFTAAALISGSDLVLTGGANEVWIFQIGSELTLADGIHVVLAGEAQAGNIFWQVGTSATLGVGSVMQGTIMADQSITLANGATLNGRALTSIAAVTLANASVTRPPLDPNANPTAVESATWGGIKEEGPSR